MTDRLLFFARLCRLGQLFMIFDRSKHRTTLRLCDFVSVGWVDEMNVPRAPILCSLFGLLLLSAAMNGCTSIASPCPVLVSELQNRPQQNLDDVHVIFVDSPFLPKLSPICCEMRKRGMNNAIYFDPFRDGGGCVLSKHVRDIRAENPNSRIMLVGWSFGALSIKSTLEHLDVDCEGIDTIVYIDSSLIKLCHLTGHPDNYDRAVMIYRSVHRPPRCLRYDAIRCVDTWFHGSVPGNAGTINQLYEEAIRLADDAASPDDFPLPYAP